MKKSPRRRRSLLASPPRSQSYESQSGNETTHDLGSGLSRRTQFLVTSIIALLAAGTGIVALFKYFHPAKPDLEPLAVGSWVWPQTAKPGETVTVTVTPSAKNAISIPGIAVVIHNFSSQDDGNGTWVDESRGFTDATGVFRLPFTVPNSVHWQKTVLTISVSKNGYQASSEEQTVWRAK